MLSLFLRILVGGAILLGAVLVAGLLLFSRSAPERKPQEVIAPVVDVIDLEPERVRFDVSSQGTVQPLTQTTLSAEVAGTIMSMSDKFVAGGTFVAGEVLLTIDRVNYRVAVERAQATLRQRQIEYDGAKKLNEQGYRAEAELASAEAALAAARADLVRAERDLDRTVVRVPYDGIVRSRAAQLGDYVTPGMQLGTVFATDIVEVRLPLPDPDLAFVDLPLVGDDAEGPGVTLSGSFRGRSVSWRGRIVRTEGTVDERNRMVFAVARVEDPYRRGKDSADAAPLPVGTFVSADIEGIAVDDVIRIPREVVRGGNQVVFVDDASELRLRTLDFLRTDADYAYVAAEQLEERRIVTTQLEAPLNGMKVRTGDDVETPDAATVDRGVAEPSDTNEEGPST